MVGVALEGGGAKGAFHIGALQALIENGYQIGGVVGTSIGAFNGAMLCQGDFEKAYDFWMSVEASTLFDIDDTYMKKLVHEGVDREAFKYLSTKTKSVIEKRGIDTSRLKKVLDELICEEKLRASDVDFGLVTVSIPDMKPLEIYKEDMPQGMVKEYIMASASFPGFQLNAINGKYYIDGGVHDNCPVRLLARKGYKEIIAIKTNQTEKFPKRLKKNVHITTVIPSEDLGKTFIFDNELIRKNIKMGYYDTLKVIHNLKGIQYYVKPDDEELLFKVIEQLPQKVIRHIGRALKLPQMDPKRMLFEKIMPTLADLLKLPITATYQDIFIGLLEAIAIQRGIERFHIYTLRQLMETIEHTSPIETVETRNKRHLFNLKKLANQLLGKHMLDEIAYVILDTVSVENFKK